MNNSLDLETFSLGISDYLHISSIFDLQRLKKFLMKNGFSKDINILKDEEFWYNFVYLVSNITKYIDIFTDTPQVLLNKEIMYHDVRERSKHIPKTGIKYVTYLFNIFQHPMRSMEDISKITNILLKRIKKGDTYNLSYMECMHLDCLSYEIKYLYPRIYRYIRNIDNMIKELYICTPIKEEENTDSIVNKNRLYIMRQLKDYEYMISIRKRYKLESINDIGYKKSGDEPKGKKRSNDVREQSLKKVLNHIPGLLDMELIHFYSIHDYTSRADLVNQCQLIQNNRK